MRSKEMSIYEAFEILEINPEEFNVRVISNETAEIVNKEIIELGLQNFKKKIMTAHSDMGGSDEEAAKLISARDIIKRLKVKYKPKTPWSNRGNDFDNIIVNFDYSGFQHYSSHDIEKLYKEAFEAINRERKTKV